MLIRLLSFLKLYRYRKFLWKNNQSVLHRGEFFFLNRLRIGRFCYIGPGSYWNAIGGITLEDGVIIGPRSFMWTENHNYLDFETIPYGGKNILKPILIEKGVWIGADVKLSPGVIIGRGAVVAMGSVVTKDVEPFTLVGGNPAREIGDRGDREHLQHLIDTERYYLREKFRKARS